MLQVKIEWKMSMRLLWASIACKVHKSGSDIRDKDGSILKTDEDILILQVPEEILPSLDIDCKAPSLLEMKDAI